MTNGQLNAKNKVNAVKTKKFRKDDLSGSPDETPNSKKPPTHPPSNCPAKAATCHQCSWIGHWASVCKSSYTVGEIEDFSEQSELRESRTFGQQTSLQITLLCTLKLTPEQMSSPSPRAFTKAETNSFQSSKTLFGPAQQVFPFLAAIWESSREEKTFNR